MKLGLLAVSLASGITKTLFTERVIINLVIVLGEWLVKRTSNDLDNKAFAVFKEALDKQYNRPTNLYRELR
jgi:hypothetical protein